MLRSRDSQWSQVPSESVYSCLVRAVRLLGYSAESVVMRTRYGALPCDDKWADLAETTDRTWSRPSLKQMHAPNTPTSWMQAEELIYRHDRPTAKAEAEVVVEQREPVAFSTPPKKSRRTPALGPIPKEERLKAAEEIVDEVDALTTTTDSPSSVFDSLSSESRASRAKKRFGVEGLRRFPVAALKTCRDFEEDDDVIEDGEELEAKEDEVEHASLEALLLPATLLADAGDALAAGSSTGPMTKTSTMPPPAAKVPGPPQPPLEPVTIDGEPIAGTEVVTPAGATYPTSVIRTRWASGCHITTPAPALHIAMNESILALDEAVSISQSPWSAGDAEYAVLGRIDAEVAREAAKARLFAPCGVERLPPRLRLFSFGYSRSSKSSGEAPANVATQQFEDEATSALIECSTGKPSALLDCKDDAPSGAAAGARPGKPRTTSKGLAWWHQPPERFIPSLPDLGKTEPKPLLDMEAEKEVDAEKELLMGFHSLAWDDRKAQSTPSLVKAYARPGSETSVLDDIFAPHVAESSCGQLLARQQCDPLFGTAHVKYDWHPPTKVVEDASFAHMPSCIASHLPLDEYVPLTSDDGFFSFLPIFMPTDALPADEVALAESVGMARPIGASV